MPTFEICEDAYRVAERRADWAGTTLAAVIEGAIGDETPYALSPESEIIVNRAIAEFAAAGGTDGEEFLARMRTELKAEFGAAVAR